MAKFTIDASPTFSLDATTFVSSVGTTAVTILTAGGSLSIAGVNSVHGSTGNDSIKLLGAITEAAALSTYGLTKSGGIAAVTAFAYDTENTTSSAVDTIVGSTAAETVTLTNTHAASPTIGANVKYTAGGTTADTVIGTSLVDTITLGAASKITFQSDSKSGAVDIVAGSSGSDTITLSDGAGTADTDNAWKFKSGGGTDILTGDNGDDAITLTAASTLTYNSGGGTDTIVGSSLNDSVKLGVTTGSTALTSLGYTTGGGVDTIIGTTSTDTITLTANASAATKINYTAGGTTNTDTIVLTAGADTLTLSAASKVNVTSGGGADVYTGSTGADTITVSGAGAITIKGAGGADTLTAGSGVTTFLFSAKGDSGSTTASADTINGFTTTTDKLSFGSGLLNGTFDVTTAFTKGGNTEAIFTDSTDLLQIDTDGNGTVDMSMTLVGVSSVTEADFIWA